MRASSESTSYDGSRGTLAGNHLDLAQLNDVQVRLGMLNSAGEQKQVDPLIITDMMSLSQKGAVSDLVLVSGDADLIVGVQFAQEFGVRVHLRTIAPTRGNTSADLRHAVDTQAEWVGADLSAFLRYTPKEILTQVAAPTTRADDKRVASMAAPRSAPVAPSIEVARGSDHATIVSTVLETLTPQELNEVATGQPGRVPGSLNHRLLGIARSTNAGAMLGEPEKRALRKLMYEAAMQRFAAERGGG